MEAEFRYWRDVIDRAPMEWGRLPLKEVFRERKEMGRDDLPLLAVTGEQGIVPRDDLERRDTSSADKSKYLRVAPGDLAYNTMRMWQGVSGVSAHEGIVSPAYTVCELRDSHDPAFMGYLCKLPLLVGRFHAFSQGIVSDTLSLRFHQFGEIVAAIPPAAEQRKIAAILLSADDAIAATRKVIEQTKRVKQGLLQTLMTRGIGHTRFKKTEIGEIPEVWELRELESLAEVAYGVTVNQSRRQSTDRVPLLTVAAHDPIEGWRSEGVSEIGAIEGDRQKYSALPGDVLLVEGNGNPDILGRPLIWDGSIPGALHQNHLIRARPVAVESEWIALALSSPPVRKQIRAHAKSSSGLYTINSRVVKGTRLPVPPAQERRAIIAAFRDFDAVFAVHSEALTALGKIKRGIMQDLLTGRVRVQPD